MPDTNSPMSQEERDVTVSGINPETGEYLTPAERKALFKKQRMGSKINPESFRSGTFSSAKKSGGGYGGGAIVKFDLKETIQSGAITQVPNEKKESSRVDETVQEVKVEDLGPTDKEKDGTEIIGNIIKAKTAKSRLSKENKDVEIRLYYDERGLDRYYGLLELGEIGGIWKNVAGRYEIDGKKVYAKAIYKEPEKYFNSEVMQALDEIARVEFSYGKS